MYYAPIWFPVWQYDGREDKAPALESLEYSGDQTTTQSARALTAPVLEGVGNVAGERGPDQEES